MKGFKLSPVAWPLSETEQLDYLRTHSDWEPVVDGIEVQIETHVTIRLRGDITPTVSPIDNEGLSALLDMPKIRKHMGQEVEMHLLEIINHLMGLRANA